jgi:hypothetical protein
MTKEEKDDIIGEMRACKNSTNPDAKIELERLTNKFPKLGKKFVKIWRKEVSDKF